MKFLKKHWSNILFIVFIVAMLIPQTRTPIVVFVQRTFAIGPSVKKNKIQLQDYHWQLTDSNKQSLSFNEAKGEVVLLNFWATWCPPCIAEMPSMQSLYDSYGDKISFYLVTDESPEKVDAFMQKYNYTLPVYYTQTPPPKHLEYRALPTTYVIGKNGEIHIRETGSARWHGSRVTDLLDKLLAE